MIGVVFLSTRVPLTHNNRSSSFQSFQSRTHKISNTNNANYYLVQIVRLPSLRARFFQALCTSRCKKEILPKSLAFSSHCPPPAISYFWGSSFLINSFSKKKKKRGGGSTTPPVISRAFACCRAPPPPPFVCASFASCLLLFLSLSLL